LWGIVFLGTPHGGGNYVTMGEIMRRVVSVVGMDTSDRMLGSLKMDGEDLERSREEFTRLWRSRFKVKTFQEARGFKGIQGFNSKVLLKPWSLPDTAKCDSRSFRTSPQLSTIPSNDLKLSMRTTWKCADSQVLTTQAISKSVAS
jgi:hypothetical protein